MLVDIGENPRLLEDPNAIGLVDDQAVQRRPLSKVLDDVVSSAAALALGGLILRGASVTRVSAKSDADLAAAFEGADLVVPAVGVGLPVLHGVFLHVVDAVEAEVVSAASVTGLLVDAAALVGWTLVVLYVEDATDITHGSEHLIWVFRVLIDEHVLHGVWTLLGGATARDCIVVAQPFRVKLLCPFVKDGSFTHLVLKFDGSG